MPPLKTGDVLCYFRKVGPLIHSGPVHKVYRSEELPPGTPSLAIKVTPCRPDQPDDSLSHEQRVYLHLLPHLTPPSPTQSSFCSDDENYGRFLAGDSNDGEDMLSPSESPPLSASPSSTELLSQPQSPFSSTSPPHMNSSSPGSEEGTSDAHSLSNSDSSEFGAVGPIFFAPCIHSMHKTRHEHLIIMRMEGRSVHDHHAIHPRHLGLATTLRLGVEMLIILEKLHARGVVHGNISPTNMLATGPELAQDLLLVGFSNATLFKDDAGELVEQQQSEGLSTGVDLAFAPVRLHTAEALSQRDDLEGLAYVMLHLRMRLPWIQVKDEAEVLRLKKEMTSSQLCSGQHDVHREFLEYVKQLQFAEVPDYRAWRARFMKAVPDGEELQVDWS